MERGGGRGVGVEATGEMAEMEGVLWGVVGGVWDDRAGRPPPERFLKSWVSEHGGSGQTMQAEEIWRRPTIYWQDSELQCTVLGVGKQGKKKWK